MAENFRLVTGTRGSPFNGGMVLTFEAPMMCNRVVAAGIQDNFHVL